MRHKSYKVELSLNNAQRGKCLQFAGSSRFIYNWGLAEKIRVFKDTGKQCSRFELSAKLTKLKSELPWLYEVSSAVTQSALAHLENNFNSFFKRCRQMKAKPGFPGFKSKSHGIGAFKFTRNNVKILGGHIQLPKMGRLKLKQPNYIPTDAKILSATVSEKAGRWFVSVLTEQPNPIIPEKSKSVIGIDLGIKTLATCSDGVRFENPKALKKNLRKLKILSRRVSKKTLGSNNRKKASSKLARLHYRISCIRKDTLHKITTHLTKTKTMIGIEDLHVAGVAKNHKLAQALADIGFGEFRRQLEYKGKWYGCQIVVANRFYPSSKTCSSCGAIKDSLSLSERTYNCSCGLCIDRDLNAAINLKNLADRSSESINDCGGTLPLVDGSDQSSKPSEAVIKQRHAAQKD